MHKSESAKEIATQLFDSHSPKKITEIIRELEKLVNLTVVKVYFAGPLNEKAKLVIKNWIEGKVKGDYSIDYIEDETLIAGFKIVYKDYIYDSSVLNSFKNEIWKQ